MSIAEAGMSSAHGACARAVRQDRQAPALSALDPGLFHAGRKALTTGGVEEVLAVCRQMPCKRGAGGRVRQGGSVVAGGKCRCGRWRCVRRAGTSEIVRGHREQARRCVRFTMRRGDALDAIRKLDRSVPAPGIRSRATAQRDAACRQVVSLAEPLPGPAATCRNPNNPSIEQAPPVSIDNPNASPSSAKPQGSPA